ncbi:MAG: L-2-hydroxyglutarate oxidase [Acidimicrobiales bacterium]
MIGGGIVGLAIARELIRRRPGLAVTVFEKEARVATQQSGHNSGVVHAGMYYKPGSLKAVLCHRGSALLREFCQEHGVRYKELGKLIVATSEEEVAGLETIVDRAVKNGVPDVARFGPAGIKDLEPHITGIDALYSPHTAAVDYPAVCAALVSEILAGGGDVLLKSEVTAISETASGVAVTVGDERHRFDQLVVCAGLQSDRVARMAGASTNPMIVPFRGEYYALRPDSTHLVRGMVYPVPDPRYPFLGVHLTRDIDDGVHVGPNAVMALALEGYRKSDINVADLLRIAAWPGTWQLVRGHWRYGIREMKGSIFKTRYLTEVRKYLPALQLEDLSIRSAGVRAQAIDRHGHLMDDFVLQSRGNITLVRNAPSPAATSSLAIADYVVSETGILDT